MILATRISGHPSRVAQSGQPMLLIELLKETVSLTTMSMDARVLRLGLTAPLEKMIRVATAFPPKALHVPSQA
jgi:hypothetical protein